MGEDKRIVCITGMERSGTSMVARVLNILGVYLGPKDKLIMETDYNEKGCWESKSLLDISESILNRFGGSTHELPRFPDNWTSDAEVSELRKRAEDIIARDFSEAGVWGWKDTRLCLTLPFWQEFLPEMEYIICIRNPADVAKSLLSREWVSSLTSGLSDWLAYTASAIRNTAGKKRTFVFYENFMSDDWMQEAARLEQFLGPSFSGNLEKNRGELEKFISRDLRHHATSIKELLENREVQFDVKSYYLHLLLFASDSFTDQAGMINIPQEELLDHLSLQAGQSSDILSSTISKLEKELEETKNLMKGYEKQIKSLKASKSYRIAMALGKITKKLGSD